MKNFSSVQCSKLFGVWHGCSKLLNVMQKALHVWHGGSKLYNVMQEALQWVSSNSSSSKLFNVLAM
jgi:hypothetical protein